LSAQAWDVTGAEATSAVVRITAQRDIRVALLEPVSGSVFPPGNNLTLCATAKSMLTDIVRVDFYCGGLLIGSATNAPYTIVWSNAPPGRWSLSAVATETAGFTGSSPAANIVVKPANPRIAGTLYVDLRANDCAPDASVWTNQGSLGDFYADSAGAPVFQTDAAGTGLPACCFQVAASMDGPSSVAALEGASPVSVEVWVLRLPPLDSQNTLILWGTLDGSFTTQYGTNLTTGTFISGFSAYPHSIGWAKTANIPAAGIWHHLVYAYDGATNFNVYVDGVCCVAQTLPSPLAVVRGPLTLGRDDFGYMGVFTYLNGDINSVRVHGGLLSSNDVWMNYLAGPCELQSGPVTILAGPQDLCAPEGSEATLAVTAMDNAPLQFQWFRDGVPVPGATNETYSLTGLQWSDSGARYCCLVSRGYSQTSCTGTSRTAVVTVLPALPVLTSFVASNGALGFKVSTVTNGSYKVEYKNDLNAPSWLPFSSWQTASNGFMSVSDIITNQHRFYRVARLH
jgi:hypothetical protein